jgi:glycyl-tRNA synthetase
MDGSILTMEQVLVSSGHVGGFSDPMVDCKTCKGRFRADNLDGFQCKEKPSVCPGQSPKCDLTEPRQFNLMLQTNFGATGEQIAYLRPETAQSIFCQYKNVLDSNRVKLPFGIAQVGKSFRNEINPRNFTFRSREFEQMEIEYFCHPEDGMRLTDEWLETRLAFYEEIGIPREKLHILDVPDGERAFYSKKTYDIEYEFPFGIQELEGVAYRTDYDIGVHQKGCGKPLEYFDEETKQRFIPHVVEPSAGCDRTVLALICEAFDEETLTDDKGKDDVRTVLRFKPTMAPIKVGIFPLLKKNEEQVRVAREIQKKLQPWMNVFYDDGGAVGRRYRRQDEVGTPYCVTVDFDTLGENGDELKGTVTLRHRDSMEQERISVDALLAWLLERVR